METADGMSLVLQNADTHFGSWETNTHGVFIRSYLDRTVDSPHSRHHIDYSPNNTLSDVIRSPVAPSLQCGSGHSVRFPLTDFRMHRATTAFRSLCVSAS